MKNYLLISGILFILFGVLWSRFDFKNVIVKYGLIIMGLFGLFFWLVENGTIVIK